MFHGLLRLGTWPGRQAKIKYKKMTKPLMNLIKHHSVTQNCSPSSNLATCWVLSHVPSPSRVRASSTIIFTASNKHVKAWEWGWITCTYQLLFFFKFQKKKDPVGSVKHKINLIWPYQLWPSVFSTFHSHMNSGSAKFRVKRVNLHLRNDVQYIRLHGCYKTLRSTFYCGAHSGSPQ